MTSHVEQTDASPRRATSAAALVWAGLAMLALAGAWFLLLAIQDGLSGGRDFVQDYAAVIKIGQGRQPYEPYNDVTQAIWGGPPHRGPLYSFHAPSSLPLLIWLLPVALAGGYVGAFVAWALVSLVSLVAVCWLTLRTIDAPRPAVAAVLAAFALIALPPIHANFDEGQLNVAVTAGMVGCWAARRAGRSGLAGVLLGAAFALKPIPGLFFLYYLWRRDWRLLGSAAATLAVLSVAGVVLSGLDGAWLWATVNYPSHASVWPGYPDNASVRGFFTRIFGPSEWRPRPPYPLPYASLLLWAATGAGLTLVAMLASRPAARDATGPTTLHAWLRRLLVPLSIAPATRRADLEFTVLAVLTLLVTPIVWPHYYVVLVMPVVLVGVQLWRLILDGRDSTDASSALPPAPPLDRRRRVVPMLAFVGLGIGVAVLAPAHYVEPFAGVGGQQLLALLLIYAASLVALWWAERDQRAGTSPEAAR